MKVLRVVTLASATGKYGGPFDTAVSQSRLCSTHDGTRIKFLAGSFTNDAPDMHDQPFEFCLPSVHNLAGRRGFIGCISWEAARELIRHVRSADLVHVSFARELLPMLASLFALVFRRKLLLQPHGMLTARTSALHKLVDLVARPIFKRADRIVALTDVERSELKEWSGLKDERKFSVIGNPLPYEPMRGGAGLATDGRRALFIARLEPRKRVQDFIDAKRFSNARGWDELYEIVGPDQGDGKAVTSAVTNTSGLIYRGAVAANDIDSILNTAGVFVLTSKNEPWGNVLVAAMIKGIPVVVTASAALADEIENNFLGLVVPDENPKAVAEAIHRILGQSWRTADQAEIAHAFSQQRFDQQAIRDSLISAYQAAIAS